jgi:hypothetical protein
MNVSVNAKVCFLRLFAHLLKPLLGLLTQVCSCEAALKPATKIIKNQKFRI